MKLSRCTTIIASFFLLGLVGCENVELPHVFTGNEVPPDVIAEPRAVQAPAPAVAQSQPWMRLGDVPSKPTDFTPQTLIDQTKQQLGNDRDDAMRLRQAADMPLPDAQQP